MIIFESSGTTASEPSRHLVKDPGIYETSFLESFELFYGPVDQYCILGLLPSYLERSHSSLVYMVNRLIHESGHPESGFYLQEFEKLRSVLEELEKKAQPAILFGVSFALLDFAQGNPIPLKHTIIIETGGMKGRRKEMIREELHQVLKEKFSLNTIHSEYGMTELLSQAYSSGNGIFHCPPWMRVCIRDEDDPLRVHGPWSIVHSPNSTVFSQQSSVNSQQSGLINIIDLANIYSCSFISTDDAGKLYPDGSFEVLGRADNSDLRGCSIMVSGGW